MGPSSHVYPDHYLSVSFVWAGELMHCMESLLGVQLSVTHTVPSMCSHSTTIGGGQGEGLHG